MSTNDSQYSLAPRSMQFFADISKECLPRIDRATVSTMGIQDDKVCHDRTGVLYRINEEHFILTAAHGLRETVHLEIPLYVSVNRPDVSPLSLAEARFHSTDEDAHGRLETATTYGVALRMLIRNFA